jgi:fructose-bisphosphate aldolase, class II
VYRAQGADMFLNADHTYSTEKVMRAISAGVDSVVVDGAKMSFEDNLRMLSTCVKYARAAPRDVVVEGELGYIGSSSRPLEKLPEGVDLENLTDPKEAALLIKESGADCIAPAVGNVHGMFTNAKEPKLHPERVKEIADATGVPVVLHGASGNSIEDILACIEAGVVIVHINTELRMLYRKELEESLKEHPKEVTPYKIMQPVHDEMKEYIVEKMSLFARA